MSNISIDCNLEGEVFLFVESRGWALCVPGSPVENLFNELTHSILLCLWRKVWASTNTLGSIFSGLIWASAFLSQGVWWISQEEEPWTFRILTSMLMVTLVKAYRFWIRYCFLVIINGALIFIRTCHSCQRGLTSTPTVRESCRSLVNVQYLLCRRSYKNAWKICCQIHWPWRIPRSPCIFTEMKNPFSYLKCGRGFISSAACLIILRLPASAGSTAILLTLLPLHSETPVAGGRIEIKLFW